MHIGVSVVFIKKRFEEMRAGVSWSAVQKQQFEDMLGGVNYSVVGFLEVMNVCVL